jgi:hypothetical protein
VTQALSQVVVVLNFILRTIFISLAECIGFKNLNRKDNCIKLSVFYCIFFQTALIPLLAPLNIPALQNVANGVYTDLNSAWFSEVGSIIMGTMVFNIFWPIIEFSLYYAIRHVKRMCD